MQSSEIFIRQPTADILQWDKRACETACTAQLFYMYGKLEVPFDTAAFDARIGRLPNEGDVQSGNLRVLLEEHFFVDQISPVDLERLVSDSSYVRDRWIQQGDSPEKVDEYFPQLYPQIRSHIVSKLDIIARYPEQYRRTTRNSEWVDVENMVELGYHVGCEFWRPNGRSHHVLICKLVSIDTYLVYDPVYGLRTMNGPAELAPSLQSGIEGYRLIE